MRLARLSFIAVQVVASFIVLTIVATSRAGAQLCLGDCNGDGIVKIDEALTGVNIELETLTIDACPEVDLDGNRVATIDELVGTIRNLLQGNNCSIKLP